MKLSDALAGYWLDKRLTMSATTIPGYEKTFRRLFDFLGDVDIESITADYVRRFWTPAGTYQLAAEKDGYQAYIS